MYFLLQATWAYNVNWIRPDQKDFWFFEHFGQKQAVSERRKINFISFFSKKIFNGYDMYSDLHMLRKKYF